MLGVKHVLAGMGGDVAPAWYSPVAVFAVVVGVLTLLAGAAYVVAAAAGALRRRREQKAVSRLLGRVDRPTPRRWFRWFRIARSGGRHA